VAASTEPVAAEVPTRSRLLGSLAVLVEDRAAVVAAIVLLVIVAFVAVFPSVSPYDANALNFDDSREGPSLSHPLGTDQFGRDLLTRIAVGGQATLTIAGLALAIIVVLGFLWGATAGLAGGWIDSLLMRVVDGLFAIPRLPIAIVILVILRLHAQNVAAMVLALSIAGWMLTARLVRGQVLSLKTRPFVTAARAAGATWPRIARRHILPNSTGVLLVAVLLELPTVVVGEAFLAVLGLGPEPPAATWGNIAYDGWSSFRMWEMTVATVAIVLFAGSANVLADGIGSILDPRRRGGRRSSDPSLA